SAADSTPGWTSRAQGTRAPWITGLVVALGIVLRLRQYLAHRSLWNDEAALAFNIVHRSFGGLLRPLDLQQGAPIGFLWVERAMVDVFGNNEYALRLFPLLAGIAAIVLFALVARRLLSGWVVPLATFLFAVLQPLVYYSTEVKQYGVDVAVGLFVVYATL